MKAFNVQPAVPVRAARNRPNVRYWIVEHCPVPGAPGKTTYSIRRCVSAKSGDENWKGGERGWVSTLHSYSGKMYARYGDALKTLRRLQELDRAALTVAGRKRHVEKMAPQLLESVREYVAYAEAIAREKRGQIPEAARIAQRLVFLADRGY